MTQEYKITLPKLGESIVSAVVVSIYKKVNDNIQKDETIVEVSTDKVNSEIPSPVAGKIKEILVKVDDTLHIGDVIAVIAAEDNAIEHEEKQKNEDFEERQINQNFYSPAVLRFAKENNLEIE